MTTKVKPKTTKKTTKPVEKKGDYVVVKESSKTGRESFGNLTRDEAIKLAAEFNKELHVIDISILKARVVKPKKAKAA